VIDNKTFWKRSRDKYFLPQDEVHVWRARLDWPSEYIAGLQQMLSPEERERAHRFHFPVDRTRNIIGRALSRILLGHCLGVAAGSIEFEYGASGKPSLANSPRQTSLNFNVSHSGDFVLVALAYDRDLGVDIERIRTDIDATELPRGAPGPTNKANAGETGPLCQRHRPRAPVGLGRRGIGWRRGRAHRHRPSPAPAGPARPGTGPSPAPRSRSRSWLVASAVSLVRSRGDFAGIWGEREAVGALQLFLRRPGGCRRPHCSGAD
jgi:hypothetical protein